MRTVDGVYYVHGGSFGKCIYLHGTLQGVEKGRRQKLALRGSGILHTSSINQTRTALPRENIIILRPSPRATLSALWHQKPSHPAKVIKTIPAKGTAMCHKGFLSVKFIHNGSVADRIAMIVSTQTSSILDLPAHAALFFKHCPPSHLHAHSPVPRHEAHDLLELFGRTWSQLQVRLSRLVVRDGAS